MKKQEYYWLYFKAGCRTEVFMKAPSKAFLRATIANGGYFSKVKVVPGPTDAASVALIIEEDERAEAAATDQ